MQTDAIGSQIQTHAPRWTACMNEFQQQPGFIAGGNKPGHAGRHHNRITNQNIVFSLTYRTIGPDNGHQFHRSIE